MAFWGPIPSLTNLHCVLSPLGHLALVLLGQRVRWGPGMWGTLGFPEALFLTTITAYRVGGG